MNNSTLCIGADIHKKDIVLRGVDKASSHEVVERFRVSNSLTGAQSAVATIAAAATKLRYGRIAIGWEATGMLWIPFHRYLSTASLLQPFEVELICFNPKLIARFKGSIDLRRLWPAIACTFAGSAAGNSIHDNDQTAIHTSRPPERDALGNAVRRNRPGGLLATRLATAPSGPGPGAQE